jgi:hypothetical protein
MKVSKNFDLWEFVSKKILAQGEKTALLTVDKRIITVAQAIRDDIDRGVFINTYNLGGHLENSGVRDFDTPIGAKYSQHKYGRAIDIKVPSMNHKEVVERIMKREMFFFNLGVRRIESLEATPTWIHIDLGVSNLDQSGIIIFKP